MGLDEARGEVRIVHHLNPRRVSDTAVARVVVMMALASWREAMAVPAALATKLK
jgi:hypothetical protein